MKFPTGGSISFPRNAGNCGVLVQGAGGFPTPPGKKSRLRQCSPGRSNSIENHEHAGALASSKTLQPDMSARAEEKLGDRRGKRRRILNLNRWFREFPSASE